MSSGNVEIVRALLAGFAEREYEAAFEVLDPEIVWDASRVPMFDLAKVYHGHDGVRAYWRGWLTAWESLEFDVEDVIELDDHEVLAVIANQVQRGRGSGVLTEIPTYGILFTFSAGKVVRWRGLVDIDATLRGAGVNRG
jgi:ketosteroid isomerase-like protein